MGPYDINSLRELFNEIFYDWGFTPRGPQMVAEEDGFCINKTYIGKDDKTTGYHVFYKTWSYSLNPKVYQEFSNFFKVYEKNSEMDFILNQVENYWHNNSVKKIEDSIELGKLTLVQKEGRFYLLTEHINRELDRQTYKQVWDLLISLSK